MKNLISMVDFTLMCILDKVSRSKLAEYATHLEELKDLDRESNIKYAKLLDSKLRLGMFIPCSLKDKPLEEPTNFKNWKLGMILTADLNSSLWYGLCKDYQDAVDRVLFSNTRLAKFEESTCVEVFYEDSEFKSYVYWQDSITKAWNPSQGARRVEDLIRLGLELKEETKANLGIV